MPCVAVWKMPFDDRIADRFLSLRSVLGRAVASIVPLGDIEDIVQETYVRVCRASVTEEIRSPRAFMLKTARNLAFDHVKRAEFRLTDPIDYADDSEQGYVLPMAIDTLDQVCAYEDFAIFCSAVRKLPLQCRRAFVLKKVYGYTQREIAHEMQISEKTVEGHIANGITRCKRIIANQKKDQASFDLREAGNSNSAPGK